MFIKRKEYGGDKVYFINERENIIIEPFGKNEFVIYVVTSPSDDRISTIELVDATRNDVSQVFKIVDSFSAKEFAKLSREVESFVEKHKTVKV
ncbi:MAG: hypothetical protein WC976_05990 [Caldisericia bacterium]